jgi:hypothetical protein
MIVHLAASLCAVLAAGPLQQEPVAAPARPTQADTARPPLPRAFGAEDADTLLGVSPPNEPRVRYFRTLLGIQFDDTTTGAGVRAVLRRHEAVVVGGMPNVGAYVVRVPDPGPTMRALDSVISSVWHDAGVHLAFKLAIHDVAEPNGPRPLSPAARPSQTAVAVSRDTSRPEIPDHPSLPDDSVHLVRSPRDSVRIYYRTMADVIFGDSVSGAEIRAFLTGYSAQIVDGIPLIRAYTIRFPDPGPTWASFDKLLRAMRAQPGVINVTPITRHDCLPILHAQHPAGAVSFGVTADVPACLAGQPNGGWILKKTVEGDPGKVDFGSRASSAPPQLVLTVVSTDTTRPPIPSAAYWPHGDDTLRTVPDSRFPEMAFFRDLFKVKFDSSAGGSVVNGFFARNRAAIIGGFPWNGEYVVRVPDPGPNKAAYDSLVDRLNHEPGVRYAAPMMSRGGEIRENSRFPSDGPGFARSDWFQGASARPAWSRLAVRAPLAWGCDTGAYGTSAPAIAIPEGRASARPHTPMATTRRVQVN